MITGDHQQRSVKWSQLRPCRFLHGSIQLSNAGWKNYLVGSSISSQLFTTFYILSIGAWRQVLFLTVLHASLYLSACMHACLSIHSFLSSLAYLLSTGLIPWNFDLACLSFIIHSISFILDPFICSTRLNFIFVIYSMSEYADKNSMNSCQIHDALKIFLISSHFPFQICTLNFIFCLSHACCCLNEEKIKLN